MTKDKVSTQLSLHQKETSLELIAVRATQYIGSLPSLILHSIFFVGIFGLQWFGFGFDKIMLILTTVVSLEAIYLSIFIQMTVNRQARQIEEVSEDIEDIQEDVEEISEDVEDIQENVEEIQEDVEEISKDVDDIQEDAKGISEDVEGIHEHIEDIKENVEDLTEESEAGDKTDAQRIKKIEQILEQLLTEMQGLKQ